MDTMIVIGAALLAVGIVIQIFTARWSRWRAGYYGTRNKPLSAFGWLLIVLGVAIMVVKAIANGQLG